MTKGNEERNEYIAAEGCFIVRIEDNKTMGEVIFLGEEDSLDNYEDRPFTEEEFNEFYNFPGRIF